MGLGRKAEAWETERVGVPKTLSLLALVACAVLTALVAGVGLLAVGWSVRWLSVPVLALVGLGWLTIRRGPGPARSRRAAVAIAAGCGALLGLVLPAWQPPTEAQLRERLDDVPSAPSADGAVTNWVAGDSALPWIAPVVRQSGPLADGQEPADVAAALEQRGYDAEVLGPVPSAPQDRTVWNVRAVDGRTTLLAAIREDGATVQASWSAPGVGTWPVGPVEEPGLVGWFVLPVIERLFLYALAVAGAALVATSVVLGMRAAVSR